MDQIADVILFYRVTYLIILGLDLSFAMIFSDLFDKWLFGCCFDFSFFMEKSIHSYICKTHKFSYFGNA